MPHISTDKRKYKVYSALLSQSGTDAPVATVLENTLVGVPIFTRLDAGRYKCTLNGGFPANKTFISGATYYDDNEGSLIYLNVYRFNDNEIGLWSYIHVNADIGDNAFSTPTPFEIRVYN